MAKPTFTQNTLIFLMIKNDLLPADGAENGGQPFIGAIDLIKLERGLKISIGGKKKLRRRVEFFV